MDVWKDLEPLRLDPDTGAEILTFGVLWELAGGRQRRLDVTVKILRRHLRRDGHSFRAHLEKLFARGSVHLLARDKRRGRFLVHVLHPEFRLVRRAADSAQLELPLEWSEGVADIDEFLRSRPDLAREDDDTIPSGDSALGGRDQTPADGSRIDAREPQTPAGSADSREAQTARSAAARMAFGRGPESTSGAAVHAGKSPRGNPRGEIPARIAREARPKHGNW